MIKNNFNAQGYKAPVCKVVKVHVQNLVCASPNGIQEAEEDEYGTY